MVCCVSADLVRLGKQFETARMDLGMSAREVADSAGISAVYLRAIERASNPKTQRPSRPSAEAILAISRTLGLDVQPALELAGYEPELAARLADSAPARGAVEDLLKQLQDSAKLLTRRGAFMSARAHERLETFTAEFRAIANGTLRCDPTEELHLTQQAVQECQSHLRAVSYEDEPWWTSKVGSDYLKLHQQLLAFRPEVEMTRIFLVEPKALPDLRHTLRIHRELGITTFVLDPKQVDEHYWRDFVLYDDRLLRSGVTTAARTDRKTAEFTDDPARIAQAKADFSTLLRLARSGLNGVEAVLEKLDDSA